MGLSTAMLSALSGLRSTQAGLDVIANNVANAGSTDYTRKRRDSQQQVVGNQAVGVRSTEVRRSLDTLLQRQSRTEAAGGAYTSTKARYHERIDQLMGTPGEKGALDTVYNDFTSKLQALTTSPDNYTARTEVVSSAQQLTQHLNNLTEDVQLLRTETEASISSAVDRANDALRNIASINDRIVSYGAGGNAPAALLDERDRHVNELASIMDIRVVEGEDNKISIFTTSGAMLFDRDPAVLTFDQRGTLDATSLYSRDPNERTTGTIKLVSPNGYEVDMIGDKLIRSGELGALIDLRDNVLVNTQAQLDELAASTASALSNREVTGTASSSGGQTGFDIDLTGIQRGNPVEISVRSGSTSTKYTFVEVGSAQDLPLSADLSSANHKVIGYTGGTAGLAAAAGTALGPSFQVSANGDTLSVLDDGAGNTTDVSSVRASITNTALQGQGDEFALFVDAGSDSLYTGSFDGGKSQRLGFAGRIGVNKDVLADRSLLVQSSSTTAAADPGRANHMYDALTTGQRSFNFGAGLGGSFNPYVGSVSGFSREIIDAQGRDAQTAKNLDEGQQVVVNSLADRFKEESGVNIDTEMANLVQLQNAYAANARIMSTIKEMLDTLMNM